MAMSLDWSTSLDQADKAQLTFVAPRGCIVTFPLANAVKFAFFVLSEMSQMV